MDLVAYEKFENLTGIMSTVSIYTPMQDEFLLVTIYPINCEPNIAYNNGVSNISIQPSNENFTFSIKLPSGNSFSVSQDFSPNGSYSFYVALNRITAI